MIFHLSQKLNAKVKAGTLAALPLNENPFPENLSASVRVTEGFWQFAVFLAGREYRRAAGNATAGFSRLHG